jgi:hypothetical protein
VREAGGRVKAEAEALAGLVSAGKVGLLPVRVLADQLDVAVAGFGYFGETLLERQTTKDGPQHDGE